MFFDKKNLPQEKIKEFAEKLEKAENKAEVITEVIMEANTIYNQDLIDQLTKESERAASDKAFKDSLGLRTLSKEENEFYDFLKKPAQAITGAQIDIIPNTVIDNTLEDVKKNSAISKLITFAPANVKKWIVASKTGKAAWGNLTATLTEEMSASFTVLNNELGKMYAMLIIPKSIAELANPFVDRYMMAIMAEAMNDGVEFAYIDGTGVDMPIGIMRKIAEKETDGKASPKKVLTTITGFSPKQLAGIKKTLSHGGLRPVGTLYLVCNPSDNYEYVEPALYGETLTGGYEAKSATKIEVIETANCPLGVGIFTLEGKYTMGFDGIKIDTYKETLAKDDANLIIAKVNGNGRATDDDTAVVFDIKKLVEYVPKVLNLAATEPAK